MASRQLFKGDTGLELRQVRHGRPCLIPSSPYEGSQRTSKSDPEHRAGVSPKYHWAPDRTERAGAGLE